MHSKISSKVGHCEDWREKRKELVLRQGLFLWKSGRKMKDCTSVKTLPFEFTSFPGRWTRDMFDALPW